MLERHKFFETSGDILKYPGQNTAYHTTHILPKIRIPVHPKDSLLRLWRNRGGC